MCCERCKRRDERDYCSLDDREKYFLIFMEDGCAHEMIVPNEFVRRFSGEIPGEIELETRNGQTYTVGVSKYPDKLVLTAGWGAFVKTYDLQIGDSVVFRYDGDSQFNVIVFDRFGREKASSVVAVADNDPLSPHEQEKNRVSTESLNRSHSYPQRMEVQSPTENVNRSQGHPQAMQMPSPTENVNLSQEHPQPMQMPPPTENMDRSQRHPQPMHMQSPTGNVDGFVGLSRHMEVQSPTENVNSFVGHSEPTQMQPPTDTMNHCSYHPQTVQMQLSCSHTERQSKLQNDYSNQGDSLPPEDDIEVCEEPRYMLGRKNRLSSAQVKEVDEMVQHIHHENPIFVAVMSKCNVTGSFHLSVSKQYVKRYMGNKVRCICLQRCGKKWEVHFGGRPGEKRIVAGWRKFVKDNDLEIGDICIFELLKNYMMCTIEVHIIHIKDLDSSSQNGCNKVKRSSKIVACSHSRPELVPTQTMKHSMVRPQSTQTQSPPIKRKMPLQRVKTLGRERDSLFSEDSNGDVDTLTDYIAVHKKRLTPIQKREVKKMVQSIDSEIPIFVVVMHKTNVTRRFTLSISKKYAEKYLGGEVQRIWLERLGERCQVNLGRRPQDTRVVGGWAKFVRDHEVEVGDICLFELLKNRVSCTMKVHIIRAKNVS
ncbi:putative B3 domain-containing protein Os08g0325100 isoform X2 [Brachypodium distachyon]|uniref:putative B3 domain-containing protein Os08g0325100 isoform X2 n=1 Tax=Brachypodium distachyon TaxID=15368 RepID=UPI0001C75300|nr:putative B3 domain-containing protein Os08g0325100 isoform X2 [Brachypodium distachyon]|eukprot:XP_024319048.1 putative B3 domain-containing protein Os08g0325100 isoform X2 [Brachypodium distachyon]